MKIVKSDLYRILSLRWFDQRLRLSLFLFFVVKTYCLGQGGGAYLLNKSVPSGPESTKFTSYYYTPPVSATGTVPVEIPLYELNIDDLKIPITLSCQTSGIPVTQLSGSVGLGWSLNVGGGIYRTINGRADEDEGTNGSTFLNPIYKPQDYLASSIDGKLLLNQNILESFADNSSDINQDNYSYNFLGHVGGLFFNNSKQLKGLYDNKIDFSYDSNALNYLTAKDDYGNTFKFDVKERTSRSERGFSVSGTTAWKLGQIITLHGQKVDFSYLNYTTGYSYASGSTLYQIKGNPEHTSSSCFSDKDGGENIYTMLNVGNKLISEVSGGNVTVVFSYSDNTKASNWQKKLDKIEVKNKKGEVIKQIKFVYSVFAGDPRLKLSKLIIETVDGKEGESFSFEYYEERGGMPEVGSMSKDNFGYYNGARNTTLLKLYNIRDFASGMWDADREVDANYVYLGSLKKIIYPTSGGMNLYYSANKSGNVYAPGIRVDRLELFDSGNNVVNTKIFEYSGEEGLWMTLPDSPERTTPISPRLFLQSFSYYSENTRRRKHLPENFFYRTVEIKEIADGKETNIVESYDDPVYYQVSEPLEGYVYQPKLTERKLYKGSISPDNLVKSEQYNYTSIVSAVDVVDMYELLPSYFENIDLKDNNQWIFYTCFSYQEGLTIKSTKKAKWFRLDSKKEETHYESGSPSLVTTSYTYFNPNHQYPTSIATTSSQGGVKTLEVKYPHDMVQSGGDPDGVYQEMTNKNAVSIPIVSLEKMGGETKGKMNQFAFSSYGVPILSRVKSLDIVKNEFEDRIRYDLHDKYGNVLQQQEEFGVPMCFVYGYGGQHIIAQIDNAIYSDIIDVLGEDVLESLNLLNVSEATIKSAMDKLRSHVKMAKSGITSFVYKSGVGKLSMTDFRGMTEYYVYDNFNRLWMVKDHDGNIVKTYCYNYKGQVIDCFKDPVNESGVVWLDDLKSIEDFVWDNPRAVITLWADWCGPCRMNLPRYEALAIEMKADNVAFAVVDVDELDSDDLNSFFPSNTTIPSTFVYRYRSRASIHPGPLSDPTILNIKESLNGTYVEPNPVDPVDPTGPDRHYATTWLTNSADITSFIQNNERASIILWRKNCTDCIAGVNRFNLLAGELIGEGISFGVVDIDHLSATELQTLFGASANISKPYTCVYRNGARQAIWSNYFNESGALYVKGYLTNRPPVVRLNNVAEITSFLQNNDQALIHVWASWCGACKLNLPMFEGLAWEIGGPQVAFAVIDADQFTDGDLTMLPGVTAPSTYLFKSAVNKLVIRSMWTENNISDLRSKITQGISSF